MRLDRYLDETGESATAFARRADVKQQTLSDILSGSMGPLGCKLVTAWRIVLASRAKPTRYGATVEFEDLLPAAAFQREAPPGERHVAP